MKNLLLNQCFIPGYIQKVWIWKHTAGRGIFIRLLSPNIVSVIKSKNSKSMRQVARSGEIRNSTEDIVVVEPEAQTIVKKFVVNIRLILKCISKKYKLNSCRQE